MFEIPHESGSLYTILSHMIYNDLNMTKIESRPIPEQPFEYRFFVDFEGNLADAAVENAILGIKEEAARLKSWEIINTRVKSSQADRACTKRIVSLVSIS